MEEGDHKLKNQNNILWKNIEILLIIYTVSQSMHSSEQNLFGITDACNAFLLHFRILF